MIFEGYRWAAAALVACAATAGAVLAQQPAVDSTVAPPDGVAEETEVMPGAQPRPTHVVMRVDESGAHLIEGQLVRIIGPINPNGDYLVIPLPARADAPSRWIMSVYWARRLPKTSSLFHLTDVRARDSAQHQTETTHSIIMEIVESGPDGPTVVEFSTTPHDGSLGVHGGSAHLTSG